MYTNNSEKSSCNICIRSIVRGSYLQVFLQKNRWSLLLVWFPMLPCISMVFTSLKISSLLHYATFGVSENPTSYTVCVKVLAPFGLMGAIRTFPCQECHLDCFIIWLSSSLQILDMKYVVLLGASYTCIHVWHYSGTMPRRLLAVVAINVCSVRDKVVKAPLWAHEQFWTDRTGWQGMGRDAWCIQGKYLHFHNYVHTCWTFTHGIGVGTLLSLNANTPRICNPIIMQAIVSEMYPSGMLFCLLLCIGSC